MGHKPQILVENSLWHGLKFWKENSCYIREKPERGGQVGGNPFAKLLEFPS